MNAKFINLYNDFLIHFIRIKNGMHSNTEIEKLHHASLISPTLNGLEVYFSRFFFLALK